MTYGAPDGVGTLLHDAQFRLRATSYWAMYGLWQVAGLTPPVYHAASLLLHIANTWLVFFVAAAWPRMRPAAFWAAAFFAVHEGHQEAVMWFSAINELLMFLFGMASLWCWRSAPDGAKPAWLKELAGVVLFALALLSKESAIFLLPLFVLVVEPDAVARAGCRASRRIWFWSLLGVASIAQSRSNSFRFTDGSFSLHAPFWLTWPHSFARLLWIWGWPAAAGPLRLRRCAIPASRTGGAGVDWNRARALQFPDLFHADSEPPGLPGKCGTRPAGRSRARHSTRDGGSPPPCFALMLLHNTVYLWTKKRAQFVERAAPTDRLIDFARRTPGAIWVQCFPLPPIVAEEAVRLAAGRSPSALVWSAGAAREQQCRAILLFGQVH